MRSSSSITYADPNINYSDYCVRPPRIQFVWGMIAYGAIDYDPAANSYVHADE